MSKAESVIFQGKGTQDKEYLLYQLNKREVVEDSLFEKRRKGLIPGQCIFGTKVTKNMHVESSCIQETGGGVVRRRLQLQGKGIVEKTKN